MSVSLLFRRLLLPAVLILFIAGGAIVGLAAIFGYGAPLVLGPFIWSALGVIAIAAVAIGVVVYGYSRAQGQAIYDTFGRSIGQTPRRDDAHAAAIEEAIDELALSLADRVGQASRDKA